MIASEPGLSVSDLHALVGAEVDRRTLHRDLRRMLDPGLLMVVDGTTDPGPTYCWNPSAIDEL